MALFLAAPAFAGCAIAARSDTFGAEVEFGVGGILSYVADIHFKGKVGFSKTCKEAEDEKPRGRFGDDPFGLEHFL